MFDPDLVFLWVEHVIANGEVRQEDSKDGVNRKW